MKKTAAIILAILVMMTGVTAFAAGQQGALLTEEEAKAIALEEAGAAGEKVWFRQVQLEWDDGRQVYEIEFFVAYTAYEMNVDAHTGEVTDFSVERYDIDDTLHDDDDDRGSGWDQRYTGVLEVQYGDD